MNEFEKSVKTLNLENTELTVVTVKSAYKKLIKVHHPDLFTSPKNKEKATENFKKIKKAYEYLISYVETNPQKTTYGKAKSNPQPPRQKQHKSGEPIEEQYADTVKHYKEQARKFQSNYYTCNNSAKSTRKAMYENYEDIGDIYVTYDNPKSYYYKEPYSCTFTKEDKQAIYITLVMTGLLIFLWALPFIVIFSLARG